MPSLREMQRQFRAAIFAAPDAPAPDFVAGGAPAANRRIATYRGSIYGNLRAALRGVYPVVDRLVGRPFFDFAAARFIRDTPSPSGDIHCFGREFPEFLRGFPPAAGLAYLPDVASLEWQAHEICHAAEAPPLDFAALAALPPEAHGSLGFGLNPACRLLASPYPVDHIWQANQPEVAEPGSLRLDTGTIRLLVRRRGGVVELQRLSQGGYLLLEQLHGGRPFPAALHAALAAQPDFDATPFLLQQARQGTLAEFHLLVTGEPSC